MLFLLLRDGLNLTGKEQANAYRILQGSVRTEGRFREHVRYLEWELGAGIDPDLATAFLREAAQEGLGDHGGLLDEFRQCVAKKTDDSERVWALVGRLRATLARVSVGLLTPDLIILDEFQRFRELLDNQTEAGLLAHHLFRYREDSGNRAKVLLLSATPFKPYTLPEEAQGGEDHYRDFLQLLGFLANDSGTDRVSAVAETLTEYRRAIITKTVPTGIVDTARHELLKFMVRTERPRRVASAMSQEIVLDLKVPPETDLREYVAIRDLAKHVNAPFSIEYWKSAPYFTNFMDGYKLADKVRAFLGDPDTREGLLRLLGRTAKVDREAMERLERIDLGNERMRALADQTVGKGWWKLLWVPPSLGYLAPEGPFAEPWARGMSKVLVFSSWAATPAAVAALLSYEADRLAADEQGRALAPEQRRRLRSRLAFRMDSATLGERPSSMSTLALFWPMPGLARLADPRQPGVSGPRVRVDTAAGLRDCIVQQLRSDSSDAPPSGVATSHWYEALRRPDSHPANLTDQRVQEAFAATDSDDDLNEAQAAKLDASARSSIRARHVALAMQIKGRDQDRQVTDEVLVAMADLSAHSPANAAFRALSRVVDDSSSVSQPGHWVAAVRLSGALRALFSRPETVLLLDQLMPGGEPYWRKILRYCAWGNLQATLDEYVHHLHVALGAPKVDDLILLELADMASVALRIRESAVTIFDESMGADAGFRRRVQTRFALRFGGRREQEDSARQPVVRQAFNSPFQPFVLATTSVGQEGVDFHWWSRAVFHWNTPANPIDFEQREGRVDRYDGLAVRRNLADEHGQAALIGPDPNVWRELYRLADGSHPDLGSFAPHWVYPGTHSVERHVAPYPLSVDAQRLDDVKRDVALYRLTFGQPRQEDMMALMKARFADGDPSEVEGLRIDLSAPPRPSTENMNASRDEHHG